MKKIFIFLVIALPLVFAGIFILDSIDSESFPMIRETPLNESEILEETYKSALEYCENNYKDNTLKKTEEFKKCIDSVEIWYEEITQK